MSHREPHRDLEAVQVAGVHQDSTWMASPRTAPRCPAAGHTRRAGQWVLGSVQATVRPRLLPVPRASFERAPRGKRRTRPSLGFLLAPPCALSPAHKGSRVSGLGAPTSPRARAEELVWDAPELQPGSAWPPPARAIFLGAPSGPGIPSEGASEWTFLFKEMCLCAVSLRRLRAVQTLR